MTGRLQPFLGRLLRGLALILVLATLAFPAVAQTALSDAERLFSAWEREAQEVEEILKVEDIDRDRSQELRDLLDPHRLKARELAELAKAELAPLQAQLEALGPPPEEGETEAEDIASERRRLRSGIEELKATLSKADLAFVRADRLIASTGEAQRRRFTGRLMTRGPSPAMPQTWTVALTSFAGFVKQVIAEAGDEESRLERAQLWKTSGPLALGALVFALVLLLFVRRWALRKLTGMIRPDSPERIAGETDRASFGGLSLNRAPEPLAPTSASTDLPKPTSLRRLVIGLGVTLTRLVLPIMAIAALGLGLERLQVLGPTAETVVKNLLGSASMFVIAYALIYAFFAPDTAALRLSTFDDANARRASNLCMLLALALALNIALIDAGTQLGERSAPVEALSVINFVIILFAAMVFWRLARLCRDCYKGEVVGGLETTDVDAVQDHDQWFSSQILRIGRWGGYGLALATPLLAAGGFFALSRFLFENSILTVAVVAVCIVLFLVAQEAMDALYEASSTSNGGDQAKSLTGKAVSEPRFGLLPVFVGFVLTLLAMPVVALIWGATVSDLEEVYFAVTDGITVGETTFRPGDLLIAALVFGFGLFLTRLLQAVFRRVVMPRTRFDVGVRSSIVSGLGYLGFFASALIAIGAGGLDLTNLAFLGAALGVGIGFGLQNIVNNFVSGVILLIERPIKVGDWIEVGGNHGTVQKVNVRSTEIETFDKASYIVPNSDLISGAVMNFTHGDLMGRVICPVGVAYDTDVRKVERILLEIARAHPMVLRRPAPFVVFQGFGASALDFELRAYLRDVNWVLTVRSDVNFEIYRRFQEEEIEIPFSQTDVTVRGLENSVDKLAGALSPRHAVPPQPSDAVS